MRTCPLKLYQIVNTFRYETKQTRPLIRLREITSFKEAHTAHATWEDAVEFLDNTCLKAGLPRGCWKDERTEVYTFEGQVFTE